MWYIRIIMEQEPFNTAIADLAQTLGLLMRRVRAAAASQQLSLTESSVLTRLSKEGPATISELARAESVKPQSMGATVTALEEQGLVERRPHPTDGRQVNIVLTDKGTALREETRAAKRTWLAEAVAKLDAEEQQTLFRAAEIIKRLVE
jgi:DNA-binding MarR family transcriptional regulator